jgi:hypothetical protein
VTVRPKIKRSALRVAIYWIIVLIPLGWGVYQSIVNSLPLFGASADSTGARDSVAR